MGKDEQLSSESKGKNPFILKRLWKRFKLINWKDPLNKWKLLFFSVVAFIGIASFSYGALAATSTTSFCSTCHEMGAEYVTHISTSHSETKCVYCHIEPGFTNTIIGKVSAMTEVYHHVTRTQPDPIIVTKVVKDTTCLTCHSENREVTSAGDVIVNHEGHLIEGIPCVTCHAGVAHGKVVERGLNTSDTYDYWIEENADKLIATGYIRPNMGTCIDCHQQVNDGLEPWKDNDYLLSVPPVHLDDSYVVKPSNSVFKDIKNTPKDAKISMECATCHTDEDIPKNHANNDWNREHGADALKGLDQCITCHEEDKWLRRVQPDSIEDLLETVEVDLGVDVSDMFVAKSESRNANFCSTCHMGRPPSHGASDKWLTGHSSFAETAEDKERCFVCHDSQIEEILTAPVDIYCEFCHRTGFKE
ncbi:NapC/NirT family cytochrome c [Bacillaceae bacterium IKA-2]|nr:NapC/NirT family cytochrome c [Bacillaceae bacterium IKA-2]